MAGIDLCTFELGAGHYAVDASRVQEVVRGQELTRVPLAPPAIAGLINMRGALVTAVDLRRLLGLEEDVDAAIGTNLVVQADGEVVSLLVDGIGDVIRVDEAMLEPPPHTLPAELQQLLTHSCQLPETVLLVLDVDRAMVVAAARA